ncbi:MAG: hypothetical protein HPY65_18965 [Syntrophaceae bacterium]|nr:hypothetical protein [Syntrophaceae bacterium]
MAERKLMDLTKYTGPDQIISSHEMCLKFQNEGDNTIKVMSQIPGLDAATDGFRGGELIAVSGPTKNGKTLLAQSLTVNFAKQQHFPLWFTFEVPARQFLGQFQELPLIYMPAKLKAYALPWLEERVYESFQKYRTRIIFVDHLHYLVDLARMRNASIEIGTVIRQLKTMAVDGGFIIFLLCHTTKGRPENLSYEAIRDSSFVSQESDSVFMVQRTPLEGENSAEMRVEFHRRTGCMERVIPLVKVDCYLQERIDAGRHQQD